MVVKARGTARQHIQKELNRKEKEAMSGNPARTNPQGSEQTDGGSNSETLGHLHGDIATLPAKPRQDFG